MGYSEFVMNQNKENTRCRNIFENETLNIFLKICLLFVLLNVFLNLFIPHLIFLFFP